jgi:SHS2 domain-containing protein
VTGSYRFVEHTGEVELELEAPTREGLFEAATEALAELLGADGLAGEPETAELSLRAEDDGALLAAWLDELVFLAETEGLVPVGVERVALGEGTAQGRVTGVRGEPPHLVKGATYHRLAVERLADRWCARVVLDV